MKLALFSDIHANLPALKAFFESIEKERPDMLFCLGDLVGFNIWPNEVVNEIRKRNIATLAGNHDFVIGRLDKSDMENYDPKDPNRASTVYTVSIIGDEERNYLGTLPLHINLKLQFKKTDINLLMVHASTISITELLYETTDEAYLLSMMQHANADIFCFGHTHKPFHKVLGENKHAINIGSVGKPKDGDPRGCYVMLTISEGEPVLVDVNFVRFEYDIEEAARAVEGSVLPREYGDMLRRAY